MKPCICLRPTNRNACVNKITLLAEVHHFQNPANKYQPYFNQEDVKFQEKYFCVLKYVSNKHCSI